MSILHKNNQAIKYINIESTSLEENVQRVIQEEIGETDQSRKECLRILREKLKELEEVDCCMEEGFLLKFLRVAKFDCEKAFERIKGYYNMQEMLTRLLKNTSIPLSTIRNMKYTFALPYRPEDNSIVTITRMEVKDLDPCLDEAFLLAFLRVAKYDVTKAFQRIINYYTQHDKLLDAFEGISMSVSTARSPQHIWASPYRLENNSILVVGRGPTFDFNSITLVERFYLEVVVVNSFINNPLTQLYGITAIFDYAGFRYSSIFHYTPGIVRLLVNTLQNSLPLPVKACHIVNLPPFLASVVNVAFTFLSKKIRSRITFHPSNDGYKSLHAVMNPDLLPEEFGGNIKQSKMIDLSEKIDELELELMERFKFGYIKSQQRRENFRLNPPINAHKAEDENNVNGSSADNDA